MNKRFVNRLLISLAATSMMAGPVQAQKPQPRPPAIRSVAPAPAQSRAVPRQITNVPVPRPVQQVPNWRPFQRGVDVRTPGFSFSIFYSNGMPFYNNIPGYIYSNMWFPGWCGPRPMFRSDIEYMQWYNISRFVPTVGEARAIRNGIPAYAPDWVYREAERQITNPAADPLLRENQELREKLAMSEGERLGYERAVRDLAAMSKEPVQQPQQATPQSSQQIAAQSEKKFIVKTQYAKVDKIQYAGEANTFYNNGLFEGLRKVTDGDVDIVAFIESDYRIGVRDKNNGMVHLVGIDLSKYSNCLKPEELEEKFVYEIINRLDIDAAKINSAMFHVQLEKRSNYIPSACRGG